jgi:hypothetical protein
MKSYFLKQRILLGTLMTISVLTILIFSSCSKEEAKNNNDNYYVKYIINGNGTYGRFSNGTVTTPEAAYTNSGYQVRSWN